MRQQQIRLTQQLLSIDGTDRRTYRQTNAQTFHRPCSAYYAGSADNAVSGTTFLLPIIRTSQMTTWHKPHLLLRAVLRRGCCSPPARRPCSNRSISPGYLAHSIKPAAAACSRRVGQTDIQTDGRTDARQMHRLYSACCTGNANNVNTNHHHRRA